MPTGLPFNLRVPPSGPNVLDLSGRDLNLAHNVLTVTADGSSVYFAPPGGGGGAVDSVFGRVGVVVAQSGDYDASEVANDSSVAGASVKDALNTLLASGGSVASVFGRSGVVVAVSGDYDASEVNNDSAVTGASVAAALNTLNTQSIPLSRLAQSGAANNQYPSWNGAAWVATTPLTAPANPADNSKVAIATNGDFSYALIADVNVGAAAAIAGSKIAPQFGAQVLSVTGAGTLQVGTTPATAGDMRVKHAFSLQGLSSVGALNRNLWDWGVTTVDTLTLGTTNTFAIEIRSFNGFVVRSGTSNTFFLAGTALRTDLPAFQFAGTVPAEVSFVTTSVAAAGGQPMTVHGQDCTGTGATVGGNNINRAGVGATEGVWSVTSAAGVNRLRVNATGLGFFTAAPIAQPVAVGALTDSTTGTPATTLVDVGAVPTQAAINNNFASVLTKLNAINAKLSQAAGGLGLTA